MTIEEFYLTVGGSFADVSKRLPTLAMVEKYIKKFAADLSYSQLCEAFNSGDMSAAFVAAHTLKGVAGNLGFSNLFRSSSAVTEALRGNENPDAAQCRLLLDAVVADYDALMNASEKYFSAKN